MSARSAISAGPTSTTRAACRSRRSSATRSRPPSSRTSPEGPDAERAIERLAREGCKLIFTHVVRLHGRRAQGRRQVPGREVRACDRLQDSPTTWRPTTPASTRAATCIGQIAAKMSKSGTAGYIVSFPIPEVVMGINSFMLGAQSVNPDFKVEDRLGEFLVRSGQGSRRRQGAVRPGRRHHRPAHRFDRRPADRRGARAAGLRPGVRHDQVRAEGAAHRDRRQLGAVLHQPRAGAARRHLDLDRHLGRHQGRRRADGALHQHARRRGGDGRRDAEEDHRAAATRSPGRSPSRTARNG